MMITKAQLKKFHVLLQQRGYMDVKPKIVKFYSNGRTTSSRELYRHEAKEAIAWLTENQKIEEYRIKIIRLAWDIGLIWGVDGTLEEKEVNGRINGAKIDLFLKQRGTVKKPLNDLNYSELKRVYHQFLAMKKSHEKTQFNKHLKGVLTEIGIG